MLNHPFERLIMDLLRLENTFEKQLTVEHVEDKLISKQIIPMDELAIIQQSYTPENIMQGYADIQGEASRLDILIHALSRDVAFVNRQRRNFRLMRDWSGLRPW